VAKFLTMYQYQKADERSSYDDRSAIIMDAIRRDLAIEPMEFKGKSFEGLRAYCCLRNEERTFRIDRILEINYVT